MADEVTDAVPISRPLERYRALQRMGVGAFAKFLGITAQTYRRMLREPAKVHSATKRRVLERLALPSPIYVNEFTIPATREQLDALRAVLERAQQLGVVACDAETGRELGEVWSLDGLVLRRYNPEAEEPWPERLR